MQRVSWEHSVPVYMSVHTSIPQDVYGDVQAAVDRYNSTMGRELIRIVAWGVSGPNKPSRDGTSMIFWDSNWDASLRYTEQARTTIYYSGRQLYEADLGVNALFFQGYVSTQALGSTQLDLQSLLVHEFGHVLGLAHNSAQGSVMAASLKAGVYRRDLSGVDIDSLHCEY